MSWATYADKHDDGMGDGPCALLSEMYRDIERARRERGPIHRDPMLDLRARRMEAHRWGGPNANQRYGEILQRIVSPVVTLP